MALLWVHVQELWSISSSKCLSTSFRVSLSGRVPSSWLLSQDGNVHLRGRWVELLAMEVQSLYPAVALNKQWNLSLAALAEKRDRPELVLVKEAAGLV